MSGHRFALAIAATLVALAACSHEQQMKQKPAVVSAAPPAPAPPPPKAEPPVAQEDTAKNKEDDAIYFDFDSALLRDEAHPILQRVAESVRRNGSVRIEGNCDEVGTVEYNLALGEHRARAAKEYLVHLGVAPTKIATVTYGAQRPRDPGHDDAAHAKNRRDDFVLR
jgi:peptidoglycan-associated lipoprotein